MANLELLVAAGYALRLTPADGKPVVDRGKYVLVHERQPDGSWLRAVEMFNPDAASLRRRRTKTQGGTQCHQIKSG